MSSRVLGLMVAFGLAGPHAAEACQGKTTILNETFEDDLNGWDVDQGIKIGERTMAVTLPPNTSNNKELNNSYLTRNADFCLSGQFPATVSETAAIGLIFWAQDYRNFFVFQVDTRGKAALYRYAAERWIEIYSRDAPEVNREAGSTNSLRVVAKGNLISTYVNGAKLRDLRSQPPPADARFGMYLQTAVPVEDPEGRTFRINEYKVTSAD